MLVSHDEIVDFDIFLLEIVFFLAGGRSFFKRNSVEISIEFLVLEYFLKFRSFDRSGWVFVFQTSWVTKCLVGLWLGFGKLGLTKGHAAVATCRLSGSWRDNFIGIRTVSLSLKFLYRF